MQLYVSNNGEYEPATEAVILDTVREAAKRKLLNKGAFMSGQEAAKKLLPTLIGHLEHECLVAVFLDVSFCVIGYEELSRGSIGACPAHPREVVKHALKHNAAFVILAHNHPCGGIAYPSEQDKLVTARMKQALELVEIKLLDHFIVAGNKVTSSVEVELKEAGESRGPLAALPDEVKRMLAEKFREEAAKIDEDVSGKKRTVN